MLGSTDPTQTDSGADTTTTTDSSADATSTEGTPDNADTTQDDQLAPTDSTNPTQNSAQDGTESTVGDGM